MENPRHAFTRQELIEKAMGYAYEGLDRTLDSHIKNLRRKIETDPGAPRYIETVFGVGYRFREPSAPFGRGRAASRETCDDAPPSPSGRGAGGEG
ncbi:MAG: winged helix-turn-helix transcriptional regulator [Chloroflexi bacterium]|nr:winged helix-turn-helix transcriptional regulator [Chloroflexota bacterium]